jgi:hypothetical protein
MTINYCPACAFASAITVGVVSSIWVLFRTNWPHSGFCSRLEELILTDTLPGTRHQL